jgi:hypothetical protein
MSEPVVPSVIDELASQAFVSLVSKGIYAMLFKTVDNGGGSTSADTSANLLNGYPVGGFTGGGDNVDQEEFQDQLMGGSFKTFIGGAIDAGDMTFNTYFAANKGRPPITGVVNSTMITPQYILVLAYQHTDPDKLQGFFAAGVNYLGGNDLKGEYGTTIGSSLKFKITGAVKAGTEEVGVLQKSIYGPLPYLPLEEIED